MSILQSKTTGGYQSILVLSLLIIFYCLDYFFRISTSLVITELQQQLHINTIQVGLLGSGFYLGYVLMQIPAGILLDKYKPSRVISLSILICAIAYIFFIYSTQFGFAYIFRLIVGACSAFSFLSVLHFAIRNFSVKYFYKISALTIAMGTVTASLMEVVSSYYITPFNWKSIFLGIASVALLIAFIIDRLAYREKPQQKEIKAKDYFKHSNKIFLNKPLVLNGLIGGLLYLPTSLLASLWGIPFFINTFCASKVQASLAITFLFLGWVLGSISFSYLKLAKHKPYLVITISSIFAALIGFDLIQRVSLATNTLYIMLLIMGIFSSAQVLIWEQFKRVCPSSHHGLGSAYTNVLILVQPIVFNIVVAYFAMNGNSSNYQQGLKILPLIFILSAIVANYSERKL